MGKDNLYGIGLLGCGSIANIHISAFTGIEPLHSDGTALDRKNDFAGLTDRARVVAACDNNEQRLNHFCDKYQKDYKIPLRFNDLSDFAACDDVNVVVVMTQASVRNEVIIPLLEAGKHLMIEKPLAPTLSEARTIVELAEKLNLQIAVGQNYRWKEQMSHSRQLIKEGRIGRPTFVIINDCEWRDHVVEMETDTRYYALAEMGVHYMDLLRWLLSDETIAASCVLKTEPFTTKNENGRCESSALIEFRKGTIANLIQSSTSHGRGAFKFRQFDGTGGSLIHPNYTDVIYRSSEGEDKWSLKRDFIASYGKNMALLLDAIETGVPSPNSGRDNLKTMAILDTCFQSAAEKRRVEIAIDDLEK